MTAALAGGAGKLVHDAADLGGAEADRARGVKHRGGRDGGALRVVREHVCEAHERGLALDLGVVMALDRRRDRRRKPPAAREHTSDERVVDAELAALLVNPVLGRFRAAVDLAGVPRVGMEQDELADVVQEARRGQTVAVLVADLGGEPVGGVLRRERVQAEALGGGFPHARALEEVECAHPVGERLDRLRAQQLDRADDRVDGPAGAWLARRITAMISATSDSTAVTISEVATWSLDATDSRRSRDSARAGNASSASNASVRRLPWPSFWWRSDELCVLFVDAVLAPSTAGATVRGAREGCALPSAAFVAFGWGFGFDLVAAAGIRAGGRFKPPSIQAGGSTVRSYRHRKANG